MKIRHLVLGGLSESDETLDECGDDGCHVDGDDDPANEVVLIDVDGVLERHRLGHAAEETSGWRLALTEAVAENALQHLRKIRQSRHVEHEGILLGLDAGDQAPFPAAGLQQSSVQETCSQ